MVCHSSLSIFWLYNMYFNIVLQFFYTGVYKKKLVYFVKLSVRSGMYCYNTAIMKNECLQSRLLSSLWKRQTDGAKHVKGNKRQQERKLSPSEYKEVLLICPCTCLWIVFWMAKYYVPVAILFKFGPFLRDSTLVWRTNQRTDWQTDGGTLSLIEMQERI